MYPQVEHASDDLQNTKRVKVNQVKEKEKSHFFEDTR